MPLVPTSQAGGPLHRDMQTAGELSHRDARPPQSGDWTKAT